MLSFILPQKLIKEQEADYDDIQTIITSASQRNLTAANETKHSEQAKDNYRGRKSHRVGQSATPEADGDTWIEIVVCKKSKDEDGSPQTRSLFYSVNTQRAKWDEPPSGASKIIFKKDVESLTKKKTSNTDKRRGSIHNAGPAAPRPSSSSHHQQPPLPTTRKATRRGSKTGGATIPTRARSQSPSVLKRLSRAASPSPGAPADRKSRPPNPLLSPKGVANRKQKSAIPRHSSTPKQRNEDVAEAGKSRRNDDNNRNRTRSNSRIRRTLRSMSPRLSRPSSNHDEGEKDTVASSDEEGVNPCAKKAEPSTNRKSPRRPSLNLEKLANHQPTSDKDYVSTFALQSTSDAAKATRAESTGDVDRRTQRKHIGQGRRPPDPQRPSALRPQLLETDDDDFAFMHGPKNSTIAKQQPNLRRPRQALEDVTPQRRNTSNDTRMKDKTYQTSKDNERRTQNISYQPHHEAHESDLKPSLSAIEDEVEMYLSSLERDILTIDQQKHLKQTKRISQIVQEQERIDWHCQRERPSSRQGSRPSAERPSSRQGSRQRERPSSRQGSRQRERPSSRQGSRQRERPSSRQGSRQRERPSSSQDSHPQQYPFTQRGSRSRERTSFSHTTQERSQSRQNERPPERVSSRQRSRGDHTGKDLMMATTPPVVIGAQESTPIDRRKVFQKNVSPDTVIINPVSFRNLEEGREVECVPSTRRSRGDGRDSRNLQPPPTVQWKVEIEKPDERTSRIQSEKERKMRELKRQREERMKRAALEI